MIDEFSGMSDKELLHVKPETPLEKELIRRLAFNASKQREILDCLQRINESVNEDSLRFTKRQAY